MRDRTVELPVFVALTTVAPPSPERRHAAAARSEAGRRLAHALLAGASGRTGWTIEREDSGRPKARHTSSGACFALSITHSGTLVGAAVAASGDIGIDLERHEPARDHRRLAALAFGPRERAMVERGGRESFYRLWTLREAMSKAIGEGLAMALDGIDRLPAAPHTGFWVAADRRWALAHFEPWPHTSVALALRFGAPLDAARWSPRFMGSGAAAMPVPGLHLAPRSSSRGGASNTSRRGGETGDGQAAEHRHERHHPASVL